MIKQLKLTVSVAAAMATAVALAQEGPLTLEEAVQIAQRNAFAALLAKQDVEFARGGVDQAKSALKPTVNLSASYTRFTGEVTAQIAPKEPPIIVRAVHQATIALQIVQNIDIWGISHLAVSGARALEASSQATLSATMNDIALQTKTAFMDVLRTDELLQAAEEQLVNANEHLRVARVRNDAGQTPRFDVVRFEADVAAAEQERLRALTATLVSEAGFNVALARDVGTPVELVPPPNPPTVELALEDLQEIAKENRPELVSAEKFYEFQSKRRQAQEKRNRPALNLSGNFSYDPLASGFASVQDTLSAVAQLSWPLFDGGLNRSLVRQAKADEEKARIARDQLALNISFEVRQAHLEATAARQQVITAARALDSAREALRIAQLRYSEGVGTPVELSDANVQFVSARTAVIDAIYRHHIAVANLQRAIGSEELSREEA